MNKQVFLGLSVLELSKIVIYEFWHDYVKPEYGKKAKLCYKDTDSFIIFIKTDHIYKNISEDVETMFDTLQAGKTTTKRNKQNIYLCNERRTSWKIMEDFIGLKAKLCSYLTDNNDEGKKQKTKESVL